MPGILAADRNRRQGSRPRLKPLRELSGTRLLPLLAFALAAGCAPIQETPPQSIGQGVQISDGACSDGNTTIDKDFTGSRYASCEVLGPGKFRLTISPEDDKVTNCSPWYGFRTNSERAMPIAVELHYTSCGHRYLPRLSTDNKTWQVLDKSSVTLIEGGGTRDALISLPATTDSMKVTAQELLLPDDYDQWLTKITAYPYVKRSNAGKSLEGRPVDQITIAEGKPANAQVVLIGRQHPPEVTGSLAMLPFVERLLENDELARRYRANFTTQVIPLMNPDGVTHGNWRHNMGDTDLNRDWGPFTQPETRIVWDMLKDIDSAPGQELKLFLDFHSTLFDVVYTLAEDEKTNPPGFTEAWLADYAARLPGYDVKVQPGYSASSTVSKNWVYTAYGVPTATYEIGEETDRELIPKLGRAAAEAMMQALLDGSTVAE